MVVAAAFFTFIMVLWAYFLWSRRKYYAIAMRMPSTMGLPFIGIAHKFLKKSEILKTFAKIAKDHNTKTYFTWVGIHPVVYTIDPEFIEVVLTSPDTMDKAVFYDQLSNMIGDGLFTCKFETWHKMRKLLTPSFNHKLLLDSFSNFNELSRGLCEDFRKIANGGEESVHHVVYKMALKSSVAFTMGLDFKHINNPEFLVSMERMLTIGSERIFKPWLRSQTLFSLTAVYKPFIEAKSKVIEFVENLVASKMKIHNQQKLERSNNVYSQSLLDDSVDVKGTKHIFIDQAIKLGFTFEQTVIEANFMVVAAFETTATTLFTILMCLAMHPQYQEKVYEELCSIFPNKDSDVKYEDLENLVYLDMCINEALRVIAAVPQIARICSKDFQLTKNIMIPKGTNVIVDIFNIHRDEDIWGPDATSFNPDHFLPSNFASKHKYAYLSFSKGPRNCLGWRYGKMILKATLANILRRYRFSTSFRFEDLCFINFITLRFGEVPKLEVHSR